MSQKFQMAVTGTAVVVCIHNRIKRQVTDLAVDTRRERPHLCACCENLFTRPDDTPHYCDQCGGQPVYQPMAPLPTPIGEV